MRRAGPLALPLAIVLALPFAGVGALQSPVASPGEPGVDASCLGSEVPPVPPQVPSPGPLHCFDFPYAVDEGGDTMTGHLRLAGGAALDFANGGLLQGLATTQLRYGGRGVCLATVVQAGCGDIEAVLAGFGLDGTALSGTATLTVDPTEVQRRVTGACVAGETMVAVNIDGSVGCVPANLGDITGVTAGTGLTGGGAAGEVTLAADTNYLQRRVASACVPGTSIRMITASGAVSCETDDDTLYAAGSGLKLAGTTFSLADCAANQVLKATGIGAWGCGADADTLPTAGSGLKLAGTTLGLADCAANQVLKATGVGAWGCAADADSGGDITTVTAGTGLTGGGTTGAVSLAADTNYLQRRVTGACPLGKAFTSVAADGTVGCVAGLLLTQLDRFTNLPQGTPSGFFEVHPDYVPPVNAKAIVNARCLTQDEPAGQALSFYAASRVGTFVTVGDLFAFTLTPANLLPAYATTQDAFDLTAGTAYDFGVHFRQAPPTNPSAADLCSVMVTVFSR